MAVPTLLVLCTLAFLLVRLAPGGPFDAEHSLAPEVRANLERAYGLDQPLPLQYLRWLGGVVQGDLGPSLGQRDYTVSELVAAGLPVSLGLGALALLLAVAIGLPLGVLAARRPGGLVDHLAGGGGAVALAIPAFVLAPLLALVFAVNLRWLPAAGWQGMFSAHAVLPALTLALPLAAALARLMRTSLAETWRLPFVRTAEAKGLPAWRVLWCHAFPAAAAPVVSWLGPAAAAILTGSLVVETVFGLPGTGRHLVQGALNRDYTLVLGMAVVYAVLVVAANLLVDLAYGWLDPRVRPGQRQ